MIKRGPLKGSAFSPLVDDMRSVTSTGVRQYSRLDCLISKLKLVGIA